MSLNPNFISEVYELEIPWDNKLVIDLVRSWGFRKDFAVRI